MLTLVIPKREYYDSKRLEFFETPEYTITLEHSLVSISKWESKWKKTFLSKEKKSTEETLDYIKCMTITQNVKDEVYNAITDEEIEVIRAYMDDSMSATKLGGRREKVIGFREEYTSEIIYYWMISLGIPFECQKWHINRLLTLINVCNIKNTPPEKMNSRELARRNAEVNAARKKKYNTRG